MAAYKTRWHLNPRTIRRAHSNSRGPTPDPPTAGHLVQDVCRHLHQGSRCAEQAGVERDRYVLKVLNRSFGSSILHEITTHRIEQFKRERLAGKWQGYKTHTTKPIRPGTVNRELDTLRAIFSKATEWGQLREHPMRSVKRLKVDNRRTRILTEAEQLALLAACPKKMAAMVRLALITGARFGELLALKWADVTETELWFMETKNGRARALPVSAAISAVLKQVHKVKGSPWVFTNTRTREAYTVNGVAHVFKRAVKRANILTGDVSLHTLRHTALSRMIASGYDDYTVMEISGHSSTRMLARYTHPREERKVAALDLPAVVTNWSQTENRIDRLPKKSLSC